MGNKLQLLLSIDPPLKARLENIKQKTGIPISRIVTDLISRHLDEFEERYQVERLLPFDQKPKAVRNPNDR
jgi:hypothetical protein